MTSQREPAHDDQPESQAQPERATHAEHPAQAEPEHWANTGHSGHREQLPHNIEVPVDERQTNLSLTTQVVRFFLTGVLSAIVDFGLLLILTNGFGVHDEVAKAISFVCGTTTAYLLNRRWTFKAEASWGRFVAVWALYLVTFVVQVGLYALTRPWLFAHLPDNLARAVAFVIAQGTATVINFVVQRTVIFRVR